MNIPLRWKIERKLNNISQSSYKEFPKQTILLSGVEFEKFFSHCKTILDVSTSRKGHFSNMVITNIPTI